LRQETFLQAKDARTLFLSFDDYKKIPVLGWFPYLRTIEAYSPETGNTHIEAEFSDVEINQPKAWRFEIPAHYTRER
jgi:hypothetical protein